MSTWRAMVAGVRAKSLAPSRADYLEIWELQTPGNLRTCPCLYRDLE